MLPFTAVSANGSYLHRAS